MAFRTGSTLPHEEFNTVFLAKFRPLSSWNSEIHHGLPIITGQDDNIPDSQPPSFQSQDNLDLPDNQPDHHMRQDILQFGNDACSPRGENEENFPGILVEQPRPKFRSKFNATGKLRPTKYLLTTFD